MKAVLISLALLLGAALPARADDVPTLSIPPGAFLDWNSVAFGELAPADPYAPPVSYEEPEPLFTREYQAFKKLTRFEVPTGVTPRRMHSCRIGIHELTLAGRVSFGLRC